MQDLNIAKYMGRWYEIAKVPFFYETDCQRAVANYKLNDDGTIAVTNQCYVGNDLIRTRTGTAWVPDYSNKGKLLIKFDINQNVGDYNVVWTDYQDAIVASRNGELLWWLSRNSTVRAKDVEPMLQKIRSYGYDTDKLVADKSVVTK